MNELEAAAKKYLEKAASGKAKVKSKILKEAMEGIQKSICDAFHSEPRDGFTLRMSNIGKDTRQLMLEKKYGRSKASPDFLLKMLTGSVQEHILIYILKAAGLDIKINGTVSLPIGGETIEGTWDLVYKGKMYDVKTCSEYAYNNKFVDYKTLTDGDSFGYVDQLIGYAKAEGVELGGWFVQNKSTGEFKVIEYPLSVAQVEGEFTKRVEDKIKVINSGIMPPCTGVEAETFYSKPTGNYIIGKKCRFCDHKEKCHKGAKLEPSRCSKAREKPLVWYID